MIDFHTLMISPLVRDSSKSLVPESDEGESLRIPLAKTMSIQYIDASLTLACQRTSMLWRQKGSRKHFIVEHSNKIHFIYIALRLSDKLFAQSMKDA